MTSSITTPRQPSIQREPLFTRRFIALTLADLAYFTAAGVAILALPLYVTGPVGSDAAGAGLAFGAFAVTALVLRPIAGRLTDTLGRRPLLFAGALLCAVCMIATGHASSLEVIVAIRLLFGVAEAAFFVASFAALADLAPPTRIGEALSYNSLGLYVGITGGPLLAEILIRTGGYAAAWYGAAALAVVAAVVVLAIGETRPSASAAEPAPAKLIHWKALPPALGFFASVIAMGGFLALAALFADSVGMARASVPLVVYGAVVVACRIAFARVHDRFPPLSVGAAALVTIAAGLGITLIGATPVAVIVGAAVMAVGVSFSTPAFFAAIFATAAPNERGAASGTASVFLDLGLGGGPILLGFVAAAAGIPVAFAVAAGVAVAGAGWTLSLRRR
jgi:predicted MFS family arabinose efflux permease